MGRFTGTPGGPGLPIEIRPERAKEMHDLPGRTRSVEPPMPDQEGRDSQSEVRVRNAAPLPPRRRGGGTGRSARDNGYHPKEQAQPDRCTSADGPDH